MGRHLSPYEVKSEIIAAFPPDCGELFYELQNDVSNLQLNWQNYCSLYGTSPERIELLKWAADILFGLLDSTMRYDVILRIARLTDPLATGGHDNASLPQIVARVSPHLSAPSAQRLKDQLDELSTYCDSIRDLRNRLLAHDDLATTLQYHANPLPNLSRTDIEGALERIRNLVNEIEKRYLSSTTHFQQVLSTRDAESLISILKKAREQEKQRQDD